MLRRQFSGQRFILIVAGLIWFGAVAVYLFYAGKQNKHAVINGPNEKELLADSLMALLSDRQKIGLLIFLDATIENQQDISQMAQLSDSLAISSWRISTPAFASHKGFSDTLKHLSRPVTATYTIKWDYSTLDGWEVPSPAILAHSNDSLFVKKAADMVARIFHSHGIQGIFLPPLFLNDTLNPENPQQYLLDLGEPLVRFFASGLFKPNLVFFNTGSSYVFSRNKVIPFPAKGNISSFLNHHGFSAWASQGNELARVNSYNLLEYFDDTDLGDFSHSTANMLLTQQHQAPQVFNGLLELYQNNPATKKLLEEKVRQVVLQKLVQLIENHFPAKGSPLKASSTAFSTLRLQLAERTSCLMKNADQTFPVRDQKLTVVSPKGGDFDVFEHYCRLYFPGVQFRSILPDIESSSRFLKDLDQTDDHQLIIFLSGKGAALWFDPLLLDSVTLTHKLALIDFGGGSLRKLYGHFDAALLVPETIEAYQQTAAAVIAGAAIASGKCPGNRSPANSNPFGFEPIRLKYSLAEDAGLDGQYLHETIDSIINDAIARGAFPGCQVFAAKDGKIIFNKAYGRHSYDRSQPVKPTDLYDVASVTKIAATTLAAMRMHDQGKLSVKEPLARYLKNTRINYTRLKPDTIVLIDTLRYNKELQKKEIAELMQARRIAKDTLWIADSLLIAIDTIFSVATPSLNIFSVPIEFMLLHQSGISPSLPILPFVQYRRHYIESNGIEKIDTAAIKKIDWQKVRETYYSSRRADTSRIAVAESLYLKDRWLDSLWERTKEVGVTSRKFRQYTDLNMILVQMAIDSINRIGIDRYLHREFYGPLGLRDIMYNPLLKNISPARIPPTENDRFWRRQEIRGHVHDPSAALLGGVSGNAGLFASAQDLGLLFQMLLNGGTYGGKRYLSEAVINLFTRKGTNEARGLGFDRYSPKNIIASSASPNTYGHTGFTGCCVWVDPDSGLVFVFLSNRINPSVANHRINSLRIRQKVHQAFYDAQINHAEPVKKYLSSQ